MILTILAYIAIAAILFYSHATIKEAGYTEGWREGVQTGRALGREAGYWEAKQDMEKKHV
jgi:flagellar biosynthesis/type III secretory pathway protein FliH